MPVEKPTNPAAAPDLRVDVAMLRRRGVDRHHVEVDLSEAWLASVLAGTDAEPRDPGHVELDLQLPVDGPVIVSGTLRAGFEVPCGRCLDPAHVSADGPVSATYVPATAVSVPSEDTSDEDGLGLSEDDLDTWTYADTTVDLSLMVAEAVKVAYPMRALCRRAEACRGLCSNCGAALNDQPVAPACAACGHVLGPGEGTADPASKPADGPLASALRKLQLPE
jgi:uncharacterized metal-binding protein YceD (DUF177 family)